MSAVSRLLTLVEADGVWPAEWLDAFVAMIPKAAGGSRPQDQRPITVLDVLYRIWSKGVVLTWGPTLHQQYLGTAAMGFRAESGTLHAAQLLPDVIALRRRQSAPLWLASFDNEKCFDSLPWWALFRILAHTGNPTPVVAAFESFYRHLHRRFRYGQVDGVIWHAANGLAQGCPSSPDLLNILFEPFHRWARASGLGVLIADTCIPSISFADDLALLAPSADDMAQLIDSYLQWCHLLQINVTKVQLWCNLPGTHTIQAGGRTWTSSSTFRFVGILLGEPEARISTAHFQPRVEKALATCQRLSTINLPPSTTCLLWRSAMLPQA